MTEYGILVAVDGSAQSDAAVGWAAAEAALHKLPVTVMHVVVPVASTWPIGYIENDFRRAQDDNAKLVIEHAKQALAASDPASELDIRTDVRHGAAAATLVDASEKATMIVVGSRGLGAIGAGLLGSVSRSLLHHAHCPVAVIRPSYTNASSTAPVLLGVDGSAASEAATALAFDEASRRGVELVALHAWSDVNAFGAVNPEWEEFEQEGHEVLSERLAGWREQYPDTVVRQRVVIDRAAQWLIDESADAQLVVLGSRGRGGFKRMLLGSVSTTVAESSQTPVIVVRGSTAQGDS